LISKTGAIGQDGYYRNFVEISGRLKPSADAANAGKIGVGLSNSNALVNGGYAYIQAKANGSNYDLDVKFTNSSGATTTYSNALTSAGDAEGYVSFTLSLGLELFTDHSNGG